MHFALFLTGLLWLLAAHTAADRAAQGIATRFNLQSSTSLLLDEFFFLFLLVVGFTALSWIATRRGGFRLTNALPVRDTASREFQIGVALGWTMLLICVFSMMAVADLHPAFLLTPHYWVEAVIGILSLVLGTLAMEVAFRGYIFRRLIDATGPVIASLLLSVLYALAFSFRPNATRLSVLNTFLLGLLFCMAYLRTHALWLGWGLHFGWNAAMGILFGLPIAGGVEYSSLVSTDTTGSSWFTGGAYGPEGSFITLIVVIVSMFVLYRITRDYAWQYTHPTIVSAGYAMEVAPPSAHTAMEAAAAAKPAPLVQIIGATPTEASTMPVIAEHLRSPSDPKDPI